MSSNKLRDLLLCVGILAAVSCSKEKLDEGGFRLYYSDVVEIAQNITVNLRPSWVGGTPSEFAITKVTYDGSVYVGPEFSINPATGVLVIAGAGNTTPGEYSVSISCSVDGQTLLYPDKVRVSFVNGIPEGIYMDPEQLVLDIADLGEDSGKELPTAQVLTEGEHIRIETYSIANVRKDGAIVDNIIKPLFTVSSEGVVSAVKGGPFEVGYYSLDLKLSTRSYSNDSSVGMFADAVSVRIVSSPAGITYSPASGRIEEEKDGYRTSFKSAVPVLNGSTDGLEYSMSVNPQTDKIAIDPETGVISIAEGHGLTSGSIYNIDVYAKNDFTEEPVGFRNAYTITVVDFIDPIEGFSYSDVTRKRALAWSVKPDDGLSGALNFEFTDPDAEYVRYLKLDAATGEVSAEKYNALPAGEYTVSITALNGKEADTRTAEFKLTISPNPYFFTYFSYGNNLGLSESATAGVSQFRVTSAEELVALSPEIKYTDLQSGITATYSRSVKRYLSGTTVDAGTGVITFAENGFVSQMLGIVFITAKTQDPEDSENSFSVTMPVFVDFSGETAETVIQYNPFVLRVNPKQGGRSVVPVVTGADLANFYLDFRRDFCYFNISGVREDGSELESGMLNGKDASNAFIEHLWQAYGSTNYGAKLPLAYWNGEKVKSAADLAKSPCYVDGTAGANQFSVVVNRGLWYDNGWADGAFVGQMTFSDTALGLGNAPVAQRIVPFAIWLDKDYLE